MPVINDLIAAATVDLPEEAQAGIDQGVAYVRDIASKMCQNVEYGDDVWNEIWSSATVVIFNVLYSMIPIVEGLDERIIDGITMQFFLLGTKGKAEDLESMLEP
jgi:hypothetical protein